MERPVDDPNHATVLPHRFVERVGEAARLAGITIEAADLPEDVLALLEHFIDRGDTYGNPSVDDPFSGARAGAKVRSYPARILILACAVVAMSRIMAR